MTGKSSSGTDRCPKCGKEYERRSVLTSDSPANKREDGKTVVAFYHSEHAMHAVLFEDLECTLRADTERSEEDDVER